MQFIYIPINTLSLISSGLAGEIELEAMMNAVFKHRILPNEVQTHILFYITHDSSGIRESLRRYQPDWVTNEFIIREPAKFSEAEGDKLLARKVKKTDEVVQIKVVPEGMLSKNQLEKMMESMRCKWNLAFLYEIPAPEVTTSLH